MADHTSKAALRLLDARDPRVCVLTGYQGPRMVPQHRQTGAGGRKDKHRTANILWIDSLPNGIITADADAQLIAKVYGVTVPFWADVEAVPVRYSDGCWYRLQGHEKTALTVGEAHELMHATYGPEWFDWLAMVEGSPIALARLRAWS